MSLPEGLLTGAYTYSARVDSWLGSQWLGQVPVAGGSVSWTVGQQVQGTLSLTVPRYGAASEAENARDFTPDHPEAPLACFGQELQVTVTVTSLVDGSEYTEPAGRFIIISSETDTDTVTVSAKSLLHRTEENRLVSLTVPRTGGTLASEIRRLIGTQMGVVIDEALTDRACPSSMSWGESRIDAVYEIADAWPARLREGRDGVLYLLPPADEITTAPVRVLTDGVDGTVIGVKRSWTREQVYNRVVARGQDTDDAGRPTFQAVASQTSGPLSVTGPYGIVTRFWSSPLVTSQAIAARSAQTMLASSIRRATTIPVELAPDPSLQLDEPVRLYSHDVIGAAPVELWGRVAAVELPLLYTGAARVDVAIDT
ncbi:hypothetical protein [Actinomyces qiguomingii]|uniref:hypothetical protein n=1 Tax=Actinomyces qiguomingii TaxID=2057800 RepID=UPI000CA03722|nr:hypothetical protein [Actinomyces qiguomingii]